MSEHATASIRSMPELDRRKHLSEMVRVAEREWAACEDNASRLEEGRSILMAEMKLNLRAEGLAKSQAEAEDMAKISDQFKGYVRKMHDARRAANDARAEWRAVERDYFDNVTAEAAERAQMRMARS